MSDNTEHTPNENPETDLVGAALMFEQLPPETRKALIELMRQFAAKS